MNTSTSGSAADYGWDHWITEAGTQAAAIMAVLVLIVYLVRGAIRMRRSTKNAFAEAVGEQVTKAIAPFAERLEQHEAAETTQIDRFTTRIIVLESKVSTFIETSNALHRDLRAHMKAEDDKRDRGL